MGNFYIRGFIIDKMRLSLYAMLSGGMLSQEE
jgi:hypothetical protein